MKLFFEEAVKEVEAERDFQDTKWGPVSHNGHSIGEWILLIEAELIEAKLALIKGGEGRDNVMHEILQIAALGIAAVQQHGTNATVINGRSI